MPRMRAVVARLLDRRRLRHAGDREVERHVLQRRHVRVERVGLEDHGDIAVAGIDMGHVAPADEDGALARFLEPGDQAQRRRLAAARGTEQREELARRDVEVDAFHGDDAARETLDEAPEGDGH